MPGYLNVIHRGMPTQAESSPLCGRENRLRSKEFSRVHHYLLVGGGVIKEISTDPVDARRNPSHNRAIVNVGETRHGAASRAPKSFENHLLEIRHSAARQRCVEVIIGGTVQTDYDDRSTGRTVRALVNGKN